MEQAKYDVFISYRHESGKHQAEALQAKLELKGCSVFKDTINMGGGDVEKQLNKIIPEYSNFVVVISKDCFPYRGKNKDYFLYEIGLALRLGKNVIPVYYDMEYKDIEEYLYGIEDFKKQNYITYHDDDPEGFFNKIFSFLKTKDEVLKERFKLLSKEKKEIHHKLKLLVEDNSDLKCPVCGSSNDVALTYCRICGYKFFDKFEESVADLNEQMLESDRLNKHKELWNNYRFDNKLSKNELSSECEEERTNSQSNEQRVKDDSQKKNQNSSKHGQNKWIYVVLGLIIIILATALSALFIRSCNAINSISNNSKEESSVVDSILEIPIDTTFKFNMIKIEGGTFLMGAQKFDSFGDNYDSEAKSNESPVHNVTLGSYYMSETEVTQALWKEVMETEPSEKGGWIPKYGRGNDYPAYGVSWLDVQEFIRKLNQKTNKEFRLPTEEEWEYAARGGHKYNGNKKYAGNNSIGDVAWYWVNSGANRLSGSYNIDTIYKNNCKAHSVKDLQPNELGLYDMSGNVWEWCQNGLYEYDTFFALPLSDTNRMLRGGSWFDDAWTCRVSNRWYKPANTRYSSIGFRLVLPIEASPEKP